MSKHWVKSLFSTFILLVLYLSVLISAKNHTKIFIAFLTLGRHAIANLYCGMISSYRFKNPTAKYIEIKNKFIRKLFVRPVSVAGVDFAGGFDERTNIVGLVLNIINTVMFVSFEVLLLMPKISCEPYIFTVTIGSRPRNYKYLDFELNSLNEIIPAEASRAFCLAMALVFWLFVFLFERQLKEHRRKIAKTDNTKSPYKPFKKTEWYYPLYTALVEISVRRNNKKHKFWYETDQLNEIEALVHSAGKHAELKLKRKGDKLGSFTVFDALNNHVMFTGFFR